MLDYDEYERRCEKIRKANDKLISLFQNSLIAEGLSEKTVKRHVGNAKFYINDYLLRTAPRPMKCGIREIGSFLGYYAIRTCLCSSPYELKSVAAGIKKFYKCMAENGKIENRDYDDLCMAIKWAMPYWIEDCIQFRDPSQPSPFIC